jgi:hypothetical protein
MAPHEGWCHPHAKIAQSSPLLQMPKSMLWTSWLETPLTIRCPAVPKCTQTRAGCPHCSALVDTVSGRILRQWDPVCFFSNSPVAQLWQNQELATVRPNRPLGTLLVTHSPLPKTFLSVLSSSTFLAVASTFTAPSSCSGFPAILTSLLSHLPCDPRFCLFSWFFQTGSHNIGYADLKLMILLSWSPECQDDRHVPPSRTKSLYLRYSIGHFHLKHFHCLLCMNSMVAHGRSDKKLQWVDRNGAYSIIPTFTRWPTFSLAKCRRQAKARGIERFWAMSGGRLKTKRQVLSRSLQFEQRLFQQVWIMHKYNN